MCGIRDYLRDSSGSDFALRVVREIKSAMRRISRDPLAGHLREDLTRLPFRFWTVSPYFIVYTGTRRPIAIVRVLHSSRNVGRLLKQP